MPTGNNICQEASKFEIMEQQKCNCLWDNGQIFDNFEELLCQGKLFDRENLISNIGRVCLC